MNVFIDTTIVNYALDIEESRPDDPTWQKNVNYLRHLLGGPVTKGDMTFYVNPSVMWQINNTEDQERKAKLLAMFREFRFTEFNLTVFPFHFPVKFITEE